MFDCNVIEESSLALAQSPAVLHNIDLNSYDHILHCNSGGKDSVSSLLALIEAGAPRDRIELHHQLVDGTGSTLMDWPVSRSYVDKLGEAFGIPVYHSWREGGIEREMCRDQERTAPVTWQTVGGQLRTAGGDRGKESTRRKFPQQSSDLRVRWCSAYAKIDVFARVVSNEERFHNKRILVVTGERAEESAARANYLEFETHRSDLRNGIKVKRHVDHIRPIHKWSEAQVWAMLEKYRVNPHPAYWLGFSRASCRDCIFNGPNEWATVRTHMPAAFIPIANYETNFGVTIHRNLTVNDQADRGVPFPCSLEMLLLAESHNYYSEIILPEGQWKLPPGAFKGGAGPS